MTPPIMAARGFIALIIMAVGDRCSHPGVSLFRPFQGKGRFFERVTQDSSFLAILG